VTSLAPTPFFVFEGYHKKGKNKVLQKERTWFRGGGGGEHFLTAVVGVVTLEMHLSWPTCFTSQVLCLVVPPQQYFPYVYMTCFVTVGRVLGPELVLLLVPAWFQEPGPQVLSKILKAIRQNQTVKPGLLVPKSKSSYPSPFHFVQVGVF
jgi:hypothetical protein